MAHWGLDPSCVATRRGDEVPDEALHGAGNSRGTAPSRPFNRDNSCFCGCFPFASRRDMPGCSLGEGRCHTSRRLEPSNETGRMKSWDLQYLAQVEGRVCHA